MITVLIERCDNGIFVIVRCNAIIVVVDVIQAAVDLTHVAEVKAR